MTTNKEILDILFNRYVIIFVGEFGKGKTLSMIALSSLLSLSKNKYNILSNIPLTFKKLNQLYTIKPLIETSQFDGFNDNIIFLLDELHRDINSRQSMSQKNTFINLWVTNLRKKDSRVFGSVQFLDWIDRNLGNICELIIIPSFVNNYNYDKIKEIEIRLKKKDFLINWRIIDKINITNYNFKINLYPFINFYSTKFSPLPLVANHEEYYEKLRDKSIKKFEDIKKRDEAHIEINKDNFYETYNKLHSSNL